MQSRLYDALIKGLSVSVLYLDSCNPDSCGNDRVAQHLQVTRKHKVKSRSGGNGKRDPVGVSSRREEEGSEFPCKSHVDIIAMPLVKILRKLE